MGGWVAYRRGGGLGVEEMDEPKGVERGSERAVGESSEERRVILGRDAALGGEGAEVVLDV